MSEVIGIDHIYISVSDPVISEQFYDTVLMKTLSFRKNRFELGGEPHIQYFNRLFGYVLRPSHSTITIDPYTPGLHHFCLRVDSVEAVKDVSTNLRLAGIDASETKCYPEYAPDYWATFFSDPDGLQLEVTNYRLERRERYDNWDSLI